MKNDLSFKLLAAVIFSGAVLAVIDPLSALETPNDQPPAAALSSATVSPVQTLVLIQR